MNFLYLLFLSLLDFYSYKHIRKKSYYLLIFGPLSRSFLQFGRIFYLKIFYYPLKFKLFVSLSKNCEIDIYVISYFVILKPKLWTLIYKLLLPF